MNTDAFMTSAWMPFGRPSEELTTYVKWVGEHNMHVAFMKDRRMACIFLLAGRVHLRAERFKQATFCVTFAKVILRIKEEKR